MTSTTSLCNRALSAIGARASISSLTEDSVEANECALLYDPERRSLLREANWNFATAPAVTLTLLDTSPWADSTNPPDEDTPVSWSFMPWTYQYAYPSDCIKFRQIIAAYGSAPYPAQPQAVDFCTIKWQEATVKNDQLADIKVLLTNQVQAVGIYTRDIQDPSMFDEGFQAALVGRLAEKLAIPLSGNLSLAKTVIGMGEAAIAAAKAQDGNEGSMTQGHTPDWIRARGYSGGWYGGYPWEQPIGNIW